MRGKIIKILPCSLQPFLFGLFIFRQQHINVVTVLRWQERKRQCVCERGGVGGIVVSLLVHQPHDRGEQQWATVFVQTKVVIISYNGRGWKVEMVSSDQDRLLFGTRSSQGAAHNYVSRALLFLEAACQRGLHTRYTDTTYKETRKTPYQDDLYCSYKPQLISQSHHNHVFI